MENQTAQTFGKTQLVSVTNIYKRPTVRIGFSKNGYVNKRNERPVVISIRRGNQSVQIATGIYSSLGKIDARLKEQLESQVNNIAVAIGNIPDYHLKSLQEIKSLISTYHIKTASFVEFGKFAIANSKRSNGTKKNYSAIFKDIEEFCPNMLIMDFNYSTAEKFIKFLRNKGKSNKAIAAKIQQIKTILTMSEKQLELSHSTFHNIEFSAGEKSVRESHLTQEDVNTLEEKRLSLKKR